MVINSDLYMYVRTQYIFFVIQLQMFRIIFLHSCMHAYKRLLVLNWPWGTTAFGIEFIHGLRADTFMMKASEIFIMLNTYTSSFTLRLTWIHSHYDLYSITLFRYLQNGLHISSNVFHFLLQTLQCIVRVDKSNMVYTSMLNEVPLEFAMCTSKKNR